MTSFMAVISDPGNAELLLEATKWHDTLLNKLSGFLAPNPTIQLFQECATLFRKLHRAKKMVDGTTGFASDFFKSPRFKKISKDITLDTILWKMEYNEALDVLQLIVFDETRFFLCFSDSDKYERGSDYGANAWLKAMELHPQRQSLGAPLSSVVPGIDVFQHKNQT